MSRELKYGLIAGFITLLWMAVGYYLGWERVEIGKYASYLSLVILAVAIYLAILFKRDRDQGGAITFNEAFKVGLAVSFVVGLMVGAFLLIYVEYINPGYADEMARTASDYYKSEHASQEQIDKGIAGVKAMYSPFGQFTYGIGTTMLTGLIITLIVGAIMRRNK